MRGVKKMFTEGEKCLGKGAKKFVGRVKNFWGGEIFMGRKRNYKGVKNEVTSKKRSPEKILGNKGKKGELRTVKGNFFKQEQFYHMYCYGSVPCIYRDDA